MNVYIYFVFLPLSLNAQPLASIDHTSAPENDNASFSHRRCTPPPPSLPRVCRQLPIFLRRCAQIALRSFQILPPPHW